MSTSTRLYPNHIYDQQRIKLARTILEKELRKLFLGVADGSWKAIDASIQGWVEDPVTYHLEDGGPRDFWDCFAAIMESVKLKPSFTLLITAENIHWKKVSLPVDRIQMTSPLDQLKKVPELHLRLGLPFAELIDVLKQHPEALPEQKILIDKHSTDPAQDDYPIIVKTGDNGLYKVMDGNRRTLKAVIYGRDEIDAWVGELDGEKLRNYWVPLNDMFQLVKVYKHASDINNDELKHATARVLRSYFDQSTVSELAYQARIGNQNDDAAALYELAMNVR